MLQNLSSKLPQVEDSIFAKMSALAHREGAINLSQGYPDFPIAADLIKLVTKAYTEGYNQYAPMPGILTLREAITDKVKQLYGASYHPETEVTITAGATQAIYTAISALVKKDDEVIVFGPSYDCYSPAVKLQGGKVIELELKAPHYSINWLEVEQHISENTKMMIINSPHNPTGAVLQKEDLVQLKRLTDHTNIIILSDEVYEHIIFDEQEHQSVAKLESLRQRSLITASFGKTFHATGWKMGYCLAPEILMKEFRKIHQFNVFSVNHPVQVALSAYLVEPKNYLQLPEFYHRKRDFFIDAISGSKFTIKPTGGTYFQLLGYENISDEKDVDFAIRLTKEFKIASIPISVFYANKTDHKMLRFCFAKNEDTLKQSAEILNKIGT